MYQSCRIALHESGQGCRGLKRGGCADLLVSLSDIVSVAGLATVLAIVLAVAVVSDVSVVASLVLR